MSSTSSAAGILLQYRNKFLLCKRAAFGMNVDGFWCVPAGHQDEGECPRETAIRELYEETRILLCGVDLKGPLSREKRMDQKGNFFLYHYYSPVLLHPTLNVEHEGYAYFEASELPTPMLDSTRKAILSLTS